MRALRVNWRRLGRPISIATALALLLQVALPPAGAFGQPLDALLALGSICHAAAEDHGNRAPQPLSDHECCHCLPCQAGFAAFLPPPLAAPVAGPAAVAVATAQVAPDGNRHGDARPAYASRAPPTVG